MDASEAPGALAKMIEECEVLRRRVLEKPEQVLTRWVNERAVGVPSVAAMRLNHCALEDRCLDEFYNILKIAWVIPEGGLGESELLAIEDGLVEVPDDDDAEGPEPADDHLGMEEGEEEAVEADDPMVEPSDPYLEKARALLPKSPQLEIHEDAQVVKASSAESLEATTPPKAPTTPPKAPSTPPKPLSMAATAPTASADPVPALTRRQHVCTPKKLFQEEPSPNSDVAAAREIMRQRLRQILEY
ncbi:unnamed protein product [Symbiodinium necroappetens]|uniref:Uncharacterized protein n=1 Tax=Symbiodinium necroappetens TaxID=1628268 RepID=A0A812KXL3_9DINO|nr:unnamed protein product [Symbiodinium necroappetens]